MKTKLLYLSLAAVLSISPLASLAQTATATDTKAAATQTASSDAQKKDGEILQDMQAINAKEVAVSKVAVQRSSNADVKAFANHMIQDHSKNLQTIGKLSKSEKIQLVTSDKSEKITNDTKEAVEKFQKMDAKDLDKDYMEAMVKGHKKVLEVVSDDFLPDANNAAVKKYLEATKAKVADHLKMAEAVEEKLEKKSS